MSAEGGGGQEGGGGVEVIGDMRGSALQGRITRQYPQLLNLMEFVRQQNNNSFCTLYSLNNIILCSPFLFDRRPYTVEEIVNACDQLYPNKDRKICNKNGFFTYESANWLLINHPYSIAKTPYEDRGLIFPQILKMYHTFLDDTNLFSKEKALTDLDNNLITIGFMLQVMGLDGEVSGLHSISIINLQPLTLNNVNFVVIDSNRKFVFVASNFDHLFQYISSEYIYINIEGSKNKEKEFLLLNLFQKRINDKTVQELKSLHEESETPLSAGHSYYQF
jgi:hypothetical protein